jgi:putative phosphoribosyl transferase
METPRRATVVDLAEMRDRVQVFPDRAAAGTVLARMLAEYRGTDALVLAVPAGGLPVAEVIARRLGLPLDVAVVSKITPRWNTEFGYGAVAFDGTVLIDELAARQVGLSRDDIEEGIARTKAKVERRLRVLRGERPPVDLKDRAAVLVDDGLATGSTMRATAGAVRHAGASGITVAVPTAHGDAIERLSEAVDAIYCPNIRRSWRFAVAEAYGRWYDVSEEEARTVLASAWE